MTEDEWATSDDAPAMLRAARGRCGELTMAWIVNDPALSAEILKEATKSLTGMTSPSNGGEVVSQALTFDRRTFTSSVEASDRGW